MTNKEIKKVRGIFKRLEIPTYIENFCEKPSVLFETWNIRINFKDNLDIHIIFDFLDKGMCEFNLEFKGNLINVNNKIGYKRNYFRLFNKFCKDSYKFEIIRNNKLNHNLCKLFNILNISYINLGEMILLTEILINNYVIKKYVKFMWNYDITKYNQKIIDKRVKKYEEKLKKGSCNNIYYSVLKDKILDDTERLYLIEKCYNSIL